jgi:hypothetical protein
MAEAKTYQDYLEEREAAVKETVAELKLRAGSKEMQLFEEFVGIADNQNKLLFQGDALSRHRAQHQTDSYNSILFTKIHALQGSQNPEERAIGNTALEAIHYFSGKYRGPSIVDRVAVEPYYDKKKKEWKPEGLMALAGGLSIGAILAGNVGLFPEGISFMGLVKAAAIVAVTGLAVGGILPAAMKWMGEQFSGNKTPNETPTVEPEKEQARGQAKAYEPPSIEPQNSVAQIPENVRRAAKNERITILGGGGNGSMPNIVSANQRNLPPAQYGANFFSPTGIPQDFRGNAYGGYTYGANNVSPTSILPTNQYGQFIGNNLNFTNSNFGGYGNANGGIGGYGNSVAGNYYGVGVPNTRFGSVMTNGGFGVNTGVHSWHGLSNGRLSIPNQIAGVNTPRIPNIGGFAYDESKGIHMRNNGSLLGSSLVGPLPNYPPIPPRAQAQNNGR